MLAVRRDLALGMGESSWLNSDPEVLALQVTGANGRQVVVVTNLAVGYRPLPKEALTDSAKTVLATPGIATPAVSHDTAETQIAPGQTMWIEI